MTTNQENRFRTDLERMSKSTVSDMVDYGRSGWSVSFETEIAAYRVAWEYRGTHNLILEYNKNSNLWCVIVFNSEIK